MAEKLPASVFELLDQLDRENMVWLSQTTENRKELHLCQINAFTLLLRSGRSNSIIRKSLLLPENALQDSMTPGGTARVWLFAATNSLIEKISTIKSERSFAFKYREAPLFYLCPPASGWYVFTTSLTRSRMSRLLL